ncbi:metallophosphoesterase [Luteolibacter marinus]|uniref:metallophosphoesterase n=1 Tax=Luteolibacter marinus TaxID=2776705 RepID=UPI001867B473|nr:metallophosphoesterase [Luteolibacter marinus]
MHPAAIPTVALSLLLTFAAGAHPGGPSPVLAYDFSRGDVVKRDDGSLFLEGRHGPAFRFGEAPVDGGDDRPGLRFAGRVAGLSADAAGITLPVRDFTVAAWCSVDVPKRYGGILSAVEDNGTAEKGLVLGYDESRFTVSLATRGADDGDGKITTLRASTPYQAGKLHQVVATYDGTTLALYQDGEQVGTTTEQSGDILWPDAPLLTLAAYRDSNENFPHAGRIAGVRLYDTCAKPGWVAHDLEHGEALRQLPADGPAPVTPELVVAPYLQWITRNEATVRWETNFPCKGELHWGESADCGSVATEAEARTYHEVTLGSLEPEMLYYYRTRSTADGEAVVADRRGTVVESPVSTLQTANREETPFGFVVLSDTQRQDQVAGKLALAAWGLRPNFVVVAGDLVDAGNSKQQWTGQFFASMKPLIERVPLYPVLGNHEYDTHFYYDYMSLPEPEYHYTFTFGNAQFFMLDTNRDVGPGSGQYHWLDQQLAASTARWKICIHHQPPFSSDDDYGNDWKTPLRKATLGDRKAKPLVELYDKHGVDIVWSGHVHSYERTWPIRDGRPVEKGGSIYMVTGGAGGPLELAGPYRPGFQRHVKHGHHFCYVTVNGGELSIQAYDLEGRMFDQLTLTKSADDGGH